MDRVINRVVLVGEPSTVQRASRVVRASTAQADSAVLARVEGDGNLRVEAVGDEVLRRRTVTVRAGIVSTYLGHCMRRAAIVSTSTFKE
eukprot:scaffold34484_cov63-Phaeocystis_antarctica.AAC.2